MWEIESVIVSVANFLKIFAYYKKASVEYVTLFLGKTLV
jgi:hypothetical protein